jgi:DNA polymerase III delta prime subunit
MASQEQKIEDSSLENSPIQQAQAGGNLLALQLNFRLDSKPKDPEQPKVDWEWGEQKLKQQLSDIRKRLKNTLGYDRTLMDVTAEEQPSLMQRSLQAERTLHIDGKDYGSLDPNTPLIETFKRDHIDGRLLILGAPGAGKTTALLSLAEQLMCEALEKSKTVIPIVFELSTWRDDNQSIHDWLVGQLYDLFGGKRKYKRYETWLERQVLLPLLDGLDELGFERQKECTIKLKQFAQHYQHIVICCRDKEFEAVDIPNPLGGEVYLQPLTDKQIQDYLKSKKRSELWSAIQTQPDLRKLLEPTTEGDPGLFRVPLFLKLAADIYDPQQPILNQSDLLDKYIDQQLCPKKRKQDRRQDLERRTWAYKTVEKEPDWRQVRKTLSWVARQLNNNHSVELLIEKIQPSWLITEPQKRQYRWWVGMIFGLLLTIMLGLLLGLYTIQTHGPILIMVLALTLALINGIIAVPIFAWTMRNHEDIKLVEAISKIDNCKIFKMMLVFVLVPNLIIWLMPQKIPFSLTPFVYAVLIGVPIAILNIWLVADLDIKDRSAPNQGINKSWKNILTLTAITIIGVLPRTIFLGSKMSKSLQFSQTQGFFSTPLILVPIIWLCILFLGGFALIQYFALRIVLAQHGYAPYRFDKFLNYCVERKLLYPIGGRYRFLHRELLDHFDPSKH